MPETLKLDILVFAAHPDDAELACAGTILAHIAKGLKVGIIDFTRGELGTRGNAELREIEAQTSSKILGISLRENMGFADGFFTNDQAHQMALAIKIRQYRPDIVLANAVSDRHPDHGKAAKLAADACFVSGLAKVETQLNGVTQQAWRPKNIYHYIQSNYLAPDFVVDVSDFWERKMEAINAFSSQFFDPNNNEPQTFISTPEFMKLIEARGVEMGQPVGFRYGEGFTVSKKPGIKNLFDLH